MSEDAFTSIIAIAWMALGVGFAYRMRHHDMGPILAFFLWTVFVPLAMLVCLLVVAVAFGGFNNWVGLFGAIYE